MSEKSSERAMSAVSLNPRDEMQAIVRQLAGHEGSVKAKIGRAARAVGIGFSRAKDIYYGDPRVRIAAEELERARAKAEGAATADDEIKEITRLVAMLEASVSRLEARGHRTPADQIRGIARRARRAFDAVEG
jgi:hypothetical protein